MLPDHRAAARPKQVLVHCFEDARQVANRQRDDRQKRSDRIVSAPPMLEAAPPGPIGFPDAYMQGSRLNCTFSGHGAFQNGKQSLLMRQT